MFFILSKQIKSLSKTLSITSLGSTYLKTMMTFIQFISIFNSFGFINNAADSLIAKTSETLTGSIFSFFSLECVLQEDKHSPTIYLKALIYTLLPLIIMLIFAVKIFICSRKKSKTDKLTEMLISFCLTLFMLQPNIIQSALDIISCVEYGDNSSFISKDLSVKCYSNEHINWIVALAFPSFSIYALIIPTIFCVYVFKKQKELSDKDFNSKAGFLIHGYSKQKFYWEYIVLWKKIGIICCSIFLKNIHAKVALTIIILLLINHFQQRDKPFLTEKLNLLEDKSNSCLILILLLKMINYDTENQGAYYICLIIVILLEIYVPIHCIIKYLAVRILHSSKLQKMTESAATRRKSIATSYRKSVAELNSEFKEYETNLGKALNDEKVKPTQIFTKTKESSSSDNNELLLKLITRENTKLKSKVMDLEKENEILKQKYWDLMNNSNNQLDSLRKLIPHGNLPKSKGDDELLLIKMEESEILNSEFTWNYSKKTIKCPLNDFQVKFTKEEFTVNDENLIKSKDIKNIKIEIENHGKIDLINLNIKSDLSESIFY